MRNQDKIAGQETVGKISGNTIKEQDLPGYGGAPKDYKHLISRGCRKVGGDLGLVE